MKSWTAPANPDRPALMRFGISTHLYHDRRLDRDHVIEVAAHGFDAIELFATRSHFDYHEGRAIAALADWLRDAGVRLHAIHAPIAENRVNGVWGPALSIATTDGDLRRRAVEETEAALAVARRTETGFLVLHLGLPRGQTPELPGGSSRDAARRSLEEIQQLAAPLGVRLAVEVIPNELSGPAQLVELLEEDLELEAAGICLDYGHAFLLGEVVDAIEQVSGHLVTTHVHDNDGRRDAHLPPFEGAIDWPSVLIATQKVGYEGTLLFELASAGDARAVLERAQRTRERFERLLV